MSLPFRPDGDFDSGYGHLRSPAGGDAPVTQTRVRHILIRTNEVVSESDARRRLLDIREREELFVIRVLDSRRR